MAEREVMHENILYYATLNLAEKDFLNHRLEHVTTAS